MRKAMGAFALLCAIVLVTGCDKSSDTAATKTDPTAEKEPEKKEPEKKEPEKKEPEKKDPTPAMVNDAKNCPSAVDNSATTIAVEGGALVVTVEGKVEGAINLVKQRAKEHTHVDPDQLEKIEHTGKGTGGGAIGLCPVLMPKTTQKVEETDRGVKVTLTPKNAAELDQIKLDAEKRLADLMRRFRSKKAPGSLGHGSGGGQSAGGGHGGGGSSGDGSKHKEDGKAEGAAAAGDDKKDKKEAKKKKKKKRKKKKKDDDGGW